MSLGLWPASLPEILLCCILLPAPCAPVCRSLLSILPQAFTHCSTSLHTQLEDATATASQRPDSLGGFIAWQSAMHSPAAGRPSAVSSAGGGQGAGCALQQVVLGKPTGQRSFFCGGDAVRVGLLAEVEALRTLLEVLRCVRAQGLLGGDEQRRVVCCCRPGLFSLTWALR